VDAVTRSQHVAHVGEIHYTAAHSDDSDCNKDEGEVFPNTPSVFPEIVHEVLSNLDRFPSLHSLSVDFAFDFDAIYWLDSDLMMDAESAEQINEAEETVSWRALMAKTWAAVSENPCPRITTLQIRQLPGRKASTFDALRFHDFLGTLEAFDLAVHGSDNGAGWRTDTRDGHLAVVAKLDEYFFNHLKSVTQFSLRADKFGQIGLQGFRHVRLAVSAEQLPGLQSVHLERIFICEELSWSASSRHTPIR
jgi:hypothetical protein